MRIKLIFIWITVSFAWYSIATQAQELEDWIGNYTGENGQGYMQPLGDAFGANINSGMYHSAKIDSGFHLHVGVVTTTSIIADDQKTFTARTEGFFQPATTTEAPTIFGATEGTTVAGVAGTAYKFPGGFDVGIFPTAAPQLQIGSVFGTEAIFRYVVVDLDDNLGNLNLFGWGIRHSISQYIDRLPVDLAIGYFQHRFDVGDIVEAHNRLVGVQGSKDFGKILTVYGGLSYENATLDITYDYEDGDTTETVSFELEGANSFRFTAGLTLRLSVFRLYTDINLANQVVWAAGFGIGF